MSQFANIINKLSRTFNKWIMTALGIIIFFFLLSLNFDDTRLTGGQGTTVLILWVVFTLISFFYTLNGILLKRSFHSEVKRYKQSGKPVEGIRGFDEMVSALGEARNISLLITIGSFFSFLTFYLAYQSILDIMNLITIAVAFAFVAISVLFLVEYPEETSFSPGGLIGFYEPDIFPMNLDNFLSDVFLTYLDPATYMEIDEWTAELEKMLVPSFESDETRVTRVERARERVLLLAYLSISLPVVITPEIERKELLELIGEDNYEPFVEGRATGLTYNEIKKIIKKTEKSVPEAFRLIDRLVISLTDDYDYFTSLDTFFTIATKTKQGSIKESAGIMLFILNNTQNPARKFRVSMKADMNSVHPHTQEFVLTVDPQTDPYPDEMPNFVSDESDDILSILTRVLQVGDTIWFRLKPTSFGYKVVTVQAEELTGDKVFGKSVEMKFTKSLSFYAKAYLPKLSALSGVALPFLQSLF